MLFTQIATSLLVLGSVSASTFERRGNFFQKQNEDWVNKKVDECVKKYPGYHVIAWNDRKGDFKETVEDKNSVKVDTKIHFGLMEGNVAADKDYRLMVFKGKGQLERLDGDGGVINWLTSGGKRENDKKITFE